MTFDPTNSDDIDMLTDDATHAARDEFRKRGLRLTLEQVYATNDYFTALLREVLTRREP